METFNSPEQCLSVNSADVAHESFRTMKLQFLVKYCG